MTEFVFMKNPDDSQIRDIVDLYMAENWWQHGNDDSGLVRKITAGSHLFIAAIENGRVIGMGRAVSDGCSDAYIQDVTVAEAYRGKGTGSRIITLIHKKLYDDGIRWIGLIAERDSNGFYEKLGFSIMKNAVPMLRME